MDHATNFIASIGKSLGNSYSKSFLALAVLQTIYFCPMILQRAVIFPHNNGIEVAGIEIADSDRISNRKFADQSSIYVPEINQHLHGQQQAWLSTWNPHDQLDRPTFQLAGFGKAHLMYARTWR